MASTSPSIDMQNDKNGSLDSGLDSMRNGCTDSSTEESHHLESLHNNKNSNDLCSSDDSVQTVMLAPEKQHKAPTSFLGISSLLESASKQELNCVHNEWVPQTSTSVDDNRLILRRDTTSTSSPSDLNTGLHYIDPSSFITGAPQDQNLSLVGYDNTCHTLERYSASKVPSKPTDQFFLQLREDEIKERLFQYWMSKMLNSTSNPPISTGFTPTLPPPPSSPEIRPIITPYSKDNLRDEAMQTIRSEEVDDNAKSREGSHRSIIGRDDEEVVTATPNAVSSVSKRCVNLSSLNSRNADQDVEIIDIVEASREQRAFLLVLNNEGGADHPDGPTGTNATYYPIVIKSEENDGTSSAADTSSTLDEGLILFSRPDDSQIAKPVDEIQFKSAATVAVPSFEDTFSDIGREIETEGETWENLNERPMESCEYLGGELQVSSATHRVKSADAEVTQRELEVNNINHLISFKPSLSCNSMPKKNTIGKKKTPSAEVGDDGVQGKPAEGTSKKIQEKAIVGDNDLEDETQESNYSKFGPSESIAASTKFSKEKVKSVKPKFIHSQKRRNTTSIKNDASISLKESSRISKKNIRTSRTNYDRNDKVKGSQQTNESLLLVGSCEDGKVNDGSEYTQNGNTEDTSKLSVKFPLIENKCNNFEAGRRLDIAATHIPQNLKENLNRRNKGKTGSIKSSCSPPLPQQTSKRDQRQKTCRARFKEKSTSLHQSKDCVMDVLSSKSRRSKGIAKSKIIPSKLPNAGNTIISVEQDRGPPLKLSDANEILLMKAQDSSVNNATPDTKGYDLSFKNDSTSQEQSNVIIECKQSFVQAAKGSKGCDLVGQDLPLENLEGQSECSAAFIDGVSSLKGKKSVGRPKGKKSNLCLTSDPSWSASSSAKIPIPGKLNTLTSCGISSSTVAKRNKKNLAKVKPYVKYKRIEARNAAKKIRAILSDLNLDDETPEAWANIETKWQNKKGLTSTSSSEQVIAQDQKKTDHQTRLNKKSCSANPPKGHVTTDPHLSENRGFNKRRMPLSKIISSSLLSDEITLTSSGKSVSAFSKRTKSNLAKVKPYTKHKRAEARKALKKLRASFSDLNLDDETPIALANEEAKRQNKRILTSSSSSKRFITNDQEKTDYQLRLNEKSSSPNLWKGPSTTDPCSTKKRGSSQRKIVMSRIVSSNSLDDQNTMKLVDKDESASMTLYGADGTFCKISDNPLVGGLTSILEGYGVSPKKDSIAYNHSKTGDMYRQGSSQVSDVSAGMGVGEKDLSLKTPEEQLQKVASTIDRVDEPSVNRRLGEKYNQDMLSDFYGSTSSYIKSHMGITLKQCVVVLERSSVLTSSDQDKFSSEGCTPKTKQKQLQARSAVKHPRCIICCSNSNDETQKVSANISSLVLDSEKGDSGGKKSIPSVKRCLFIEKSDCNSITDRKKQEPNQKICKPRVNSESELNDGKFKTHPNQHPPNILANFDQSSEKVQYTHLERLMSELFTDSDTTLGSSVYGKDGEQKPRDSGSSKNLDAKNCALLEQRKLSPLDGHDKTERKVKEGGEKSYKREIHQNNPELAVESFTTPQLSSSNKRPYDLLNLSQNAEKASIINDKNQGEITTADQLKGIMHEPAKKRPKGGVVSLANHTAKPVVKSVLLDEVKMQEENPVERKKFSPNITEINVNSRRKEDEIISSEPEDDGGKSIPCDTKNLASIITSVVVSSSKEIHRDNEISEHPVLHEIDTFDGKIDSPEKSSTNEAHPTRKEEIVGIQNAQEFSFMVENTRCTIQLSLILKRETAEMNDSLISDGISTKTICDAPWVSVSHSSEADAPIGLSPLAIAEKSRKINFPCSSKDASVEELSSSAMREKYTNMNNLCEVKNDFLRDPRSKALEVKDAKLDLPSKCRDTSSKNIFSAPKEIKEAGMNAAYDITGDNSQKDSLKVSMEHKRDAKKRAISKRLSSNVVTALKTDIQSTKTLVSEVESKIEMLTLASENKTTSTKRKTRQFHKKRKIREQEIAPKKQRPGNMMGERTDRNLVLKSTSAHHKGRGKKRNPMIQKRVISDPKYT